MQIAEPKLRESMIIQDEYVAGLEHLERQICKTKEELAESKKVISEKDQAIAAKDMTIQTAIEALAKAANISPEEAEKLVLKK